MSIAIMKIIQLTLCFAFICGVYSSHVSESAMDDIEQVNKGGNYDQVDMKLTEEQRASFHSIKSNNRNRRSIYDKMYNARWSKAVVPVTISSEFGESEKATIYKAIRNIESVSCVRFKEYPAASAPVDHVDIYRGSGCWSYIGRTGGRQDLSLGYGCVHVHTVIHELLHALGFFHEQSRPDRNQYVTVNTRNIRAGYESNFDISEYSHKDGFGVKYDSESIMHYGRYVFKLWGYDINTTSH
ncbi:zinc metalloproteinase nas-4-like [Hydractinia symbiolongicarpus]|uniref:zinc metalloproteinase nas-4-like n=1 Tax=Hydractinia symbiolongicarpus TaxID=13093 RepID=UPI00254F68ED|nr:zinc metalloproteinase nas-4-like [Hydractinia symbiolongicarpus]